MFKTFRKERIQLAGIAGAVGVEPLLSDLQLGSAGIIEVDHSECAGFILVGGGEGGRESGNPSRAAFYIAVQIKSRAEAQYTAFRCM
jgi:hypothetical protein